MRKRLECGSVFPGCRFVIHADGDDELMAKAIAHACAEHGTTPITDRLKGRIRSAIRDEPPARTEAA